MGPPKQDSLRVLELYAGIGGMHCGLQRCFSSPNVSYSSYEVVSAIDINEVAGAIYRHNFSEVNYHQRSIEAFSLSELETLEFDMVTMSPPCQPFTRQGLKKDQEDARTNSLFHFLSLLEKMKPSSLPKFILVENVFGFETSTTRDSLVKTLTEVGFRFQEFLLTPPQFGIPNSRLRYFLIGKREPLKFSFPLVDGVVLKDLPDFARQFQNHKSFIETQSDGQESSPKRFKKSADEIDQISDFLETGGSDKSEEYLLPDNVLRRYKVMDVTSADSRRSCCFTKSYGRYVDGTGSFLQPSNRDGANRDSVAKVIETKHSVVVGQNSDLNETTTPVGPKDLTEEDLCLLRSLKLRYFSPKEIARIHCLPDSFGFPSSLSRKQCWKALGNSLNAHIVSVLMRILLTEEESC